MTRAEHIRWCKERAREYLKRGDLTSAIASMLSDLTKHPETEGLADLMGPMVMLGRRDVESVSKWIEGFTE